jgi:hypothetical protein
VIDILVVKMESELNEYLRIFCSFAPARMMNFCFPVPWCALFVPGGASLDLRINAAAKCALKPV